jgi:ubiquinone/menaquinone biosynthesis C-methylase UbiE
MNTPAKLSKEYQEAIGPAEEYERVKVPKMLEPAARIFVNHLKVKPLARLLDVACGTGIVPRIAAEQTGFAGQITGVDLNPNMLAVARVMTPSSGVQVEWRQGDALNLPFDTDSFGLVFCQQGIQYFSDKVAAIRDMHRVLVRDSRVAILVVASIGPEGQPWK